MRRLDPHGRTCLLVILREIDSEFILGLECPTSWQRVLASLRSTWSFQATGDCTGPTAIIAGP